MTTNDVIIELLRRHVLRPDEQVERVRHWPDGLAMTTSTGRHLVAGSEAANWLVSSEAWIDDVVIADRDDLIVNDGATPAERHGFLMLADGGDIYVNDPVAVGELGRRLPDGLNPTAFAELLVEFQPYTSAVCKVLSEPAELRQLIGHDDIPNIEPPRLAPNSSGLVLTFSSICRYRWPAEGPLLDVMAWTVVVPSGEAARWTSERLARRLRLDPHPGIGNFRSNANIPAVDRNDTMPRDDWPIVEDEAHRIAEMWRDNGGTAAIRYFNGHLIVTAPRSIQEAIGGSRP